MIEQASPPAGSHRMSHTVREYEKVSFIKPVTLPNMRRGVYLLHMSMPAAVPGRVHLAVKCGGYRVGGQCGWRRGGIWAWWFEGG